MNTYKINNTLLTLQPTSGQWMPRDILGIDGNGHPIYPALREFQLSWQAISMSDFNQIRAFFQTVLTTGTATVDLPQWDGSTYTFHQYSGTILYEPEIDVYFNENVMNAKMRIAGIRL